MDGSVGKCLVRICDVADFLLSVVTPRMVDKIVPDRMQLLRFLMVTLIQTSCMEHGGEEVQKQGMK